MITMEETLTVKEVAHILRLTEYTVRVLLKRGELRGFKAGDQWRINQEALNEYRNRPNKQ